MKSIRQHLVKVLSITITGVVIVILLATDIAVDSWIDSEFNKAMKTKMGLLMTLVAKEEENGHLYFSSRFMPEFEGDSEPEYYQIWVNKSTFERSHSLELFATKNLPYQELDINDVKIIENPLPDGRAGRVIYTKFKPQELPATGYSIQKRAPGAEEPIVLAYGVAVEELNFVLWLIDIVFIVSTVSVIIFIRIFVRKSVDVGLSPLNKMNQQIKGLKLSQNNELIKLEEPVEELIPIKESLNRFIEENRQLYLREKRLTSDISHELKTPITELINLVEVVTRFPDKNELSKDFVSEVLRISNRLKRIVENVLLLHKHENVKLPQDDIFDVGQLLERLTTNLECERLDLKLNQSAIPLRSNLFAVETILSNILKNAITHSKEHTSIKIEAKCLSNDNVQITVANVAEKAIHENELELFFEPMWQSDSSRTSNANFGLGLPIAKAFAESINANITANLVEDNVVLTLEIQASKILPANNKKRHLTQTVTR